MRQKSLRLFFLVIFFQYSIILSVSEIYNYRISQITKQHLFETNTHYTTVMLLFDEFLKKNYDNIQENYFGGFASFIYHPQPWYYRIDFAGSLISAKSDQSQFSGSQTDDILISIGRNWKNEKRSITLSGLFGMPTHNVTILKHASLGYGQFGLGVQLDCDFAFNKKNSFLLGLRYINFIPRQAIDSSGNIFKFTIGNLGDILLASKNEWGKHGFEIGYTAKFDFGADIKPKVPDIIEETNYTRNYYYAAYKYKFSIKNISNKFILEASYSYDRKIKRLRDKYIIIAWATWIIHF